MTEISLNHQEVVWTVGILTVCPAATNTREIGDQLRQGYHSRKLCWSRIHAPVMYIESERGRFLPPTKRKINHPPASLPVPSHLPVFVLWYAYTFFWNEPKIVRLYLSCCGRGILGQRAASQVLLWFGGNLSIGLCISYRSWLYPGAVRQRY